VLLGEDGEYGEAGEYCCGVEGEYAGLEGLEYCRKLIVYFEFYL
jgi:hypothetical protein